MSDFGGTVTGWGGACVIFVFTIPWTAFANEMRPGDVAGPEFATNRWTQGYCAASFVAGASSAFGSGAGLSESELR